MTSRKILAASAKPYEKLQAKGQVLKGTEIDLTGEEDTYSPLASLSGVKKLKFEQEVRSDLNNVKQSLQRLEKRSMIEEETKRAFQCNICKQVVRQPVTSGCCQRLVGCKDCLDMWLAHSPVCPLCKGITSKMELKGFDDLSQGTSKDRTQATKHFCYMNEE